MECATPPSPRLTRAGKQVQPISRSTPRSADTATLRTLERRIAELENLATSQRRELTIQFERIAQLQADCDILRIRFIHPEQTRTLTPRRIASRDPGSAALESMRMTYRIERSTTARGVIFLLSGEMDSGLVAELEALMATESDRRVSLDLADVMLVNREAIKFLAGVEATGAVLLNCPDYVRSWIDAERDDA
jgi:hypothetical protein